MPNNAQFKCNNNNNNSNSRYVNQLYLKLLIVNKLTKLYHLVECPLARVS